MNLARSLQQIVSEIARDPEGKEALAEPYRVLFHVGEDEAILYLGEVDIAEEASEVDLILDTDYQTWDDLANGDIAPTDAWFDGRLLYRNAAVNRAGYVWLTRLLRIYQGRYFWSSRSFGPRSLRQP